ncbi:MAG: hypothetical protein SNJ70_05060 [Armatimonadota bacterium]
MNKPTAVRRKEIIANTGPSLYGVNRLDRVRSPKGEIFTFLGVCDGIAYIEREDKTKGEPFIEIESENFETYKKV